MNVEAFKMYDEAQILGNRHREAAIIKVCEGIACFESPMAALLDADENIQRYTRSNFTLAHFYEVVRDEALKKILGVEYKLCQTCHHWERSAINKCGNRSGEGNIQALFDQAKPGYTCIRYYPKTP